MNLETQLLFFFSALGAFNGFILSLYFLFIARWQNNANRFLGLLLFMVSTRIAKSVFLFFKTGISTHFIQIGLGACFLIGPFLYLYIQRSINEKKATNSIWLVHILLPIIVISIMSYTYSYSESRLAWGYFIRYVIYLQWLTYIILSGILLRGELLKIFDKNQKLSESEIWRNSVYSGVSLIWLAYFTSSYTSYIVGALSFSFVLYLLVLLWVFKRNQKSSFFEKAEKYANKKIEEQEAYSISADLERALTEKALFKNSNLKLADLAKEIHILPHQLSQFLNDNLGKGFTQFVNEYRIEEAKQLLLTENTLTIENIGYECGFNSKSTFFTTFKKVTGSTPANYKKENE